MEFVYPKIKKIRDLVYPKSLLTGLAASEPEAMITVWVIFRKSSEDLFWEGSRGSIRPMFFELGVSRTLRAASTAMVANPIAKQIAVTS